MVKIQYQFCSGPSEPPHNDEIECAAGETVQQLRERIAKRHHASPRMTVAAQEGVAEEILLAMTVSDVTREGLHLIFTDRPANLRWGYIALGALAAAVAAPVAVTAGVAALGFGAGGIAAGSWAAGFMASSGGAVTAGSACAVLQSIGAAGLGAAGTALAAGTGAVAGGAAAGALTSNRNV